MKMPACMHACSYVSTVVFTLPCGAYLSLQCQITLDVVEIDSEMLSVAEKWFGFAQGERLKVFIEDGVQFVKETCASGKKGN